MHFIIVEKAAANKIADVNRNPGVNLTSRCKVTHPVLRFLRHEFEELYTERNFVDESLGRTPKILHRFLKLKLVLFLSVGIKCTFKSHPHPQLRGGELVTRRFLNLVSLW